MRAATAAAIGGSVVGGVLAVRALGRMRRAADGHAFGREVVHRRPSDLRYSPLVDGVETAILTGDIRGAYAMVTHFAPGLRFARHVHPNDIHILVLSGAYHYRLDGGAEIRVGLHEYLFLPGGVAHTSGSDPQEGCVFLQQSQAAFGLDYL